MTDSKSRCVVKISTDTRPIVYLTIDRLSTAISTAMSTAMSTDISVDITHSKQDPDSPCQDLAHKCHNVRLIAI